jgi:signal transduction histidine kinase
MDFRGLALANLGRDLFFDWRFVFMGRKKSAMAETISRLHRTFDGCEPFAQSPRMPLMGKTRQVPIARFGTLFVTVIFLLAALGGCHQKDFESGHNQPVIQFTRVPLAGADDPGKTGEISGRVVGGMPGQHIVLYSKGAAAWWVQPFADQPFTNVRPDSTWENGSHPGTQYAALLVGPEFHPPTTTLVLPSEGVLATAVAQGGVPFWFKWWFPVLSAIAGFLLMVGFYRLRLHNTTKTMNLRFEERLAERMRVAQELHDTLLQGVISASMQLDVAVDHLPPDSPVLPALRHIMQIMGQVVEEGRTTLRGLRSSAESANDLEIAFLRVPEEFGADHKMAYRVLVEGAPLPLQAAVHEELYSIGREALVNAFRHSAASSIEVELEYTAERMRVMVRDNGRGIKPEVLRTGRDGHWGLSGMRERAERIGAKFKIMSGPSAGTEVEICVPGSMAFQAQPSNGRWKWFAKAKLRMTREAAPRVESEMLK